MTQSTPERVISDRHSSHPRAIAEEQGAEVEHEARSCLGNPIEQSHRGINQRYYPISEFGAFETTKRFCQGLDEVRQFLRPGTRMPGFASPFEQRKHFLRHPMN